MLPAHDAAEEILAGELPPLMVEGIAVRVVGRLSERRHPPVLPDVAVLRIAGDIAEDEVLPLARPGRALGPIGARPQPAQRRVARDQRAERRVDDDDVRVGIDRWVAAAPVAGRIGDRAGRRTELGSRRGLHLCRGGARHESGGSHRATAS
jgi:hypothetical protein